MGWAFNSLLSPAVEYRTWPIATGPGSADSVAPSKMSATYPIAREMRTCSRPTRQCPRSPARDAAARTDPGRSCWQPRVTEDAEDAALVLELIEHVLQATRFTKYCSMAVDHARSASVTDHIDGHLAAGPPFEAVAAGLSR
jgi:hypothetical protein